MVNTLMSAAGIVHAIHWLFLSFVLAGWILPWPAAWAVHLITVPALILHWRTNQNRCILTEMEERLRAASERGEPIAIGGALPVEKAEEGQFIKSVIARLTGKVPTDALLSKIIYAVMGAVWLLALSRFVAYLI